MERFKNHLLVVVGFAIAGLIGAAFGTGTAQAVVSTLVSVVNPNTSPVQTNSVNVTDPGRVAYQSGVGISCSGNQCDFNFPDVPPGHRLVIQHVSATLFFGAPPTSVVVNAAAGVGLIQFFAPFAGLKSVFDQPVLAYNDPITPPTVSVSIDGPSFFAPVTQFVTLIGYEVDCTVAVCTPIAN